MSIKCINHNCIMKEQCLLYELNEATDSMCFDCDNDNCFYGKSSTRLTEQEAYEILSKFEQEDFI